MRDRQVAAATTPHVKYELRSRAERAASVAPSWFELQVVTLEGEIAGDLAVVADPSAVPLEAKGGGPLVVVVVAQAVPLETFALQLGTDQCACADEPGPVGEIGDRRDHRARRICLARAPRGRVDLVLAAN